MNEDSNTFTVENQINTINEGYRHVVILGAGASKALCLDTPDKNNLFVPLMNELPHILKSIDFSVVGSVFEFEKYFAKLYCDDPSSSIVKNIEKEIRAYFSSLQLPNVPTIYDYLVLSLRSKDLIASFNWDPYLWQAYIRNLKFTKNLPKIVFLHGNVACGVDIESKQIGPVGMQLRNTERNFEEMPLLYPIDQKDYAANEYIKAQWETLSKFLENPARLTIFGYSAPETDIAAIRIMKKAWGEPHVKKRFAQIEIIDIADAAELKERWKQFIFSHHYQTIDSFYNSSIFKFPRRTGEVFKANFLEALFYQENCPPKKGTLEEVWYWYQKLLEKEH